MFRVDPKTVTSWAKAGKLSSIRTLGGHRRYRESEVRELLSGVSTQPRLTRAGQTHAGPAPVISRCYEDDLERARAVHALHPVELDVAGRRRAR